MVTYQNGRVMRVSTQDDPRPATALGRSAAPADPRLLAAGREIVAAHGLRGLTLDRLASASGISRMTLHRHGITTAQIAEALVDDAADQYLAAVLPPLTGPGDAHTRIEAVLQAMFVVADNNLLLLASLYAHPDSVFHNAADGSAEVTTNDVFTRPLARLLRDGALDDTLRQVGDPEATATTLFNIAGWGYIHLRYAQRWPPERASAAVLDLVLRGLTSTASPMSDH